MDVGETTFTVNLIKLIIGTIWLVPQERGTQMNSYFTSRR